MLKQECTIDTHQASMTCTGSIHCCISGLEIMGFLVVKNDHNLARKT